jgi:hypothetical protein
MAGSIRLQEGAIQTITSTGAAATSGSAILAGTLDTRSVAAAATADMFAAMFSLTAQWATITGIAANTTIADLYLVPAIDGTNFPDVDLTSGASFIAYPYRVGSFVASKAPTANTNMLFGTASMVPVELFPSLYNVYILNRSSQSISANWTLKAQAAGAQYT